MHSFVLLTLLSSVFAAPIGNSVVNAPVDAKAPVDACADIVANVVAPIDAAVGNVNAHKVNVANGAGSGNDILKRGGDVVHAPVGIVAPVDAAVKAVAGVVAPVKAAVANVNLDYVNALNGAASGNKILTRNVVNVPVAVDAPIKAVVDVLANVHAPIDAAVGNVKLDYVNVANGAVSGNKILKRDVVNAPVQALAPVKAVVDVLANVKAPIDAAVGNVKLDYVNVANGAVSGNHILKRGGDVVHAPVGVVAPVYAAVKAAANVVAPVQVDAANIDANYVNVANGAASGNTAHL